MYKHNNNLAQYIDLVNVDARSTPLSESRHKRLWLLQININLTEDVLLVFLQSGVEKLLA